MNDLLTCLLSFFLNVERTVNWKREEGPNHVGDQKRKLQGRTYRTKGEVKRCMSR